MLPSWIDRMDADSIPKLDRAGLRRFGLLTGGLVLLLFGLLLPLLLGSRFPVWPWVVGIVLAVWALGAPQTLDPAYQTWMRCGLIMGGIVNRIMLASVFFVIMVPVGTVLRISGRDPLVRRFDPGAASYRTPSRVRSASSMEKPF